DPKGAEAVLDVFKIGSPDVAKANIDITKTYTNAFVEKADKTVK
ncbi:MAG: ABC transporter substrate-binding protein, partial [Rhizobiaceae bacterium]